LLVKENCTKDGLMKEMPIGTNVHLAEH
jgi:hypothetical protein